jgi:hypothetical protein
MKKTFLALVLSAVFLASSAHATIQVDQDYNFTNGPVVGLSSYGPDAPTYSNKQVILGGDDYLQSRLRKDFSVKLVKGVESRWGSC